MTVTLNWENEQDTQVFAKKFATLIEPGDIICLSGDLGAGKTTFTRYFAHALGINQNIKSPTYTIIREYESGRLPLYHMDAYRLEETGVEGIGINEYFEGNGVCVVEWPQYIQDDLPESYLWITIKKESLTERRLEIEGFGSRGVERCQQLEELVYETRED